MKGKEKKTQVSEETSEPSDEDNNFSLIKLLMNPNEKIGKIKADLIRRATSYGRETNGVRFDSNGNAIKTSTDTVAKVTDGAMTVSNTSPSKVNPIMHALYLRDMRELGWTDTRYVGVTYATELYPRQDVTRKEIAARLGFVHEPTTVPDKSFISCFPVTISKKKCGRICGPSASRWSLRS